MVWSCEKGKGGWSVEISGRNGRLQWFGHVRREKEVGVLRLVEEMDVSGKRKVGKPRKTRKDIVKRDLELLGVEENVALDQRRWRKSDANFTVMRSLRSSTVSGICIMK